ncbi:MAG: sigma-54-dependent Fis family transcriptional regulator, partial [Desulfobacteraceae bacterium]|nr:sigma-54-dependent Fis family transcriptional regulator [Desulfobacteraceae bacterium]
MTNAIEKILLVDDEEKLLNSMAQRLTLLGFEVIKASSGTKAIKEAKHTHIDMAIVDLKMPDMDGLVTITKLKEITPDIKTILLTGYGSEKIKQATEAIGSKYFEKDSMADLWVLIKRLNTHFTTHYERGVDQKISIDHVDSTGSSRTDLPKIIGETPEMQRLRKDIERASELNSTVIIRGETGTGKELVARTIHELSYRKNQRFLAFNCGCFSNDFHFNELFDSLDNHIPHYDSKKIGAVNERFVGTILLDHFEVMPEQTQREMIKIIESKAVPKSMDAVELLMDIRFIVATHQDLKKRVEQRKFNENLYHKLNAIEMSVPSLQERRDDIPPLCSYFLSKLNKEFNKSIKSISKEVFSIFSAYPFPGNVRELKHIIERAVILAESKTIELQHLP